jgi:hypothetical protein
MVLKLRETSPRAAWEGAKCHQVDVTSEYDPFFDDEEMGEAVKFCNGTDDGRVCPLRDKCLHFALTNHEKFGVWGGMSEIGRKAIRKKMPSKGGKPNLEWEWLTEQQALEGLDVEKLKKELNEDKKD